MDHELDCPSCGRPIRDGEPRVPWFSKVGGEVDKRGAVHLACVTAATDG